MKRTPLKRKTPLKSGSMLRNRSKKKQEIYAKSGGRRDVVSSLLASIDRCEAGEIISNHQKNWSECLITPSDIHEILPRSAGGSILDRQNLLAVCRICHGWIHDNPAASRELNLLKSRYSNV